MRVRLCVLCTAAIVGACACANDDDQSVRVFAASSLTEAFNAMKSAYERDHPGVTIGFNFLSSSELALQIQEGAQAGVFASADEPNMTSVVDAGLAEGQPRVFAGNSLVIVVAPGNPERIEGLGDLQDSDLVVSLCTEGCPAGRYARAAFAKAGVEVEADSLESEVKSIVTRVAVGEADAGIAYVTDVRAAGGEVEGVEIPAENNVIARYPLVALKKGSQAAREFVEFVLSDAGQQILIDHGFLGR